MLAIGLFNSIMFPTIFTLGIANLGKHTGEGSGVLCMAIVGGAIVPLVAGHVADLSGIAISFIIPAVCYAYIVYYGLAGHRETGMKRRAVFALAAVLAAAALTPACSPKPDAAARELRRGNGSEPDSIDPQLARMEAAMTILRDSYEGPGLDGAGRHARAGRRGALDRLGRWPALHIYIASRRALVERRPRGRRRLRRRLAPPRGPCDRLAVRADAGAGPERGCGRRMEGAGRIARRVGARRDDARRRARRAKPLFPRDALAPEHLPGAPADARGEPEGIRAPGRRGDERRVHAGRVGDRLAHPREAEHGILERRGDEARRRALRARRGSATELTRFRAGDLDVTYTTPPGEAGRLRRDLPGQLHVAPTLGVYYYGLALDLPPFKDALKLRQALAMAVDREVLARQVLGDGELPAYGWVPPGVAGYEPQRFWWAGLDPAARIAEAKRLYAEAGYSAAKPLRVELRTSKSPLHDRIALAVTAMWKETLGPR